MQEMQAASGSTGLMTAQQVQDLLGVDSSTVYRMAADGRLPAVKVGRQWRFRPDRIAAVINGSAPVVPTGTASLAPIGSDPAATRPTPEPDGARLRTEIAQPVIESAADLLGVMMVVTDMQGSPLTPVANPCARFVEHADDPAVVTACATRWRELADDLDFEPRFAPGHLGFECARSYIRSGSELVGMVLVGGIAPTDAGPGDDPDLYHLDADQRRVVLDALRKVAITLSRAATTNQRSAAAPSDGASASSVIAEGES